MLVIIWLTVIKRVEYYCIISFLTALCGLYYVNPVWLWLKMLVRLLHCKELAEDIQYRICRWLRN